MMTFNIGSQTAGVIVNGDQHIAGGLSGTLTGLDAARDAARALQYAIAQSRETAAIRHHVDAIAAQVQQPVPDRRTVADRLRTLIDLLTASASVVSLGAAIVGPLRTLAEWLGDLGMPILRALA